MAQARLARPGHESPKAATRAPSLCLPFRLLLLFFLLASEAHLEATVSKLSERRRTVQQSVLPEDLLCALVNEVEELLGTPLGRRPLVSAVALGEDLHEVLDRGAFLGGEQVDLPEELCAARGGF